MLITLIYGSPKKAESASSVVLEILKERLAGQANTIQLIRPENVEASGRFPILDSNSLAVSFPLYLDGIPSGLLSFLEDLSKKASGRNGKPESPATVYAVVNSGFYDK